MGRGCRCAWQRSRSPRRVRASFCFVCVPAPFRTDLHIVDGELTRPKLPLVLGHMIVADVVGEDRRVGVPWLGWTDGDCRYCRAGLENLCDRAQFTGYDRDGGFAEYTVADERFCFPLPDAYAELDVAPLLCSGLIGYRSLRLTGDAERLGLYGFGASAHIIVQVALHQGRRVFAFTRPGDAEGQAFARELGAEWAGGSDEAPPEELDAAIIFAPVGALVPVALRALAKAGSVVCAGIHMSDIPAFPYALAPRVPVRVRLKSFALEEANEAIDHLRRGEIHGSAVVHLRASD
jgi:propanol-preferring alcohol dehydrogenase